MTGKRIFAGIALLAATTSSAAACTIPDGWTMMQVEHTHSSKIALELPPTPVKIGEPFSIDFLVCADPQPSIGNIRLDATMPAHKHGMNYKPEIVEVADNIYRGSGMFFHMPGEWQISVELLIDGESRRFLLKVPAR